MPVEVQLFFKEEGNAMLSVLLHICQLGVASYFDSNVVVSCYGHVLQCNIAWECHFFKCFLNITIAT
jgi:hypothetical protein